MPLLNASVICRPHSFSCLLQTVRLGTPLHRTAAITLSHPCHSSKGTLSAHQSQPFSHCPPYQNDLCDPYIKTLFTSTGVFTGPFLSARIVHQCHFHTSPKQRINPIVWLVVKPVAKATSIITGRYLRKQWGKLPEDEKGICKNRLWRHRGKLAAAGLVLLTAALVDYFTHIQETPITKRKRYIAFTPEQFLKIINFEYEGHLSTYQDKIVQPTHSIYEKVVDIVQKIVNANQDLEFMQQQKWTVIVVDDPTCNAFVLPTGQIFVFTGLMRLTENEDQLAVVLGHEMAHALLRHSAEQVSMGQMVDRFVILAMAGIWFFMPNDGIAVITQWFYNKVIQLFLHLPYSRKLETEADEVGLQLVAKACYDVRQSSFFWHRMAINYLVQNGDDVVLPEFLSTHPAHANRAGKLDELIPQAINIRTQCKCQALSEKDPREQINLLLSMLEEYHAKKEAEKQLALEQASTPQPALEQATTMPGPVTPAS